MRRLMLDLSQTALGEAVGVSFQQVQKYEIGIKGRFWTRPGGLPINVLTFNNKCNYFYRRAGECLQHPPGLTQASDLIDDEQ
jgi:transcriptional regulator with XRE-family HTH domain